MAMRKSEWSALIKPIVDRAGAKKDAKELAQELSDILEVKVDADGMSQLVEEFNSALKNMGKTPIVFTEKTLNGIVSQFAKAVVEGVARGVADAGNIGVGNIGQKIGDSIADGVASGVEESKRKLNELKAKREHLVRQIAVAEKAASARTKINKLDSFTIEGAHKIKVDGDIGEEADRIANNLNDSIAKIDQVRKEHGEKTIHYVNAVIDAQEAYHKYLRMQKTLRDLSVKEQATISQDTRAFYDMLDYDAREKYYRRGGTELSFDDTDQALELADAFEEISYKYEQASLDVQKFKLQLQELDATIEKLTQNIQGVNSVDVASAGGFVEDLKTLQEIEKAYDRVAQKKKRYGEKSIQGIVSATEYQPGSERLRTLGKAYSSSVESGENWEVQYSWLVKFVKEYRHYQDMAKAETDRNKRRTMTAALSDYEPLFRVAEKFEKAAITSLEALNTKLGYGSVPNEEVAISGGDADEAERIAAAKEKERIEAEKAAEAKERELKLEKEKEETLRRQREEQEKLAAAINEQSKNALADKYDQSPDDVKKKYQEVVALTDLIRGLENKTNKTPIDIDPWTATEEQKKRIVEVWREYQTVIQEIANMPVVETEDDEKRLFELIATAEHLRRTMNQGVLADSNPDGYKRVYGLSSYDEGLQMKLDMEGVNESQKFADIDKKLRARLSSLYGEANNLSQELFDDLLNAPKEEYDAFFAHIRQSALDTKPVVEAVNDAMAETNELVVQGGSSGKTSQQLADERRAELTAGLFEPSQEELENEYYIEDLERLISNNNEILNQLANENLLTEEIRDKYEAINSAAEKQLTHARAVYDAEVAAEKSLDEIDNLHDQAYATDDPDEANRVLEERKRILSEISELVKDDYEESIAQAVEENSLIEKRIALLRDAKAGRISVDDIDDIMSESGDLDSKISRLQDVSDAWGMNIKDDDIDEAEKELESFEATYDRIVLKLANGRKIEILPNAKGLRALHKYNDGVDSSAYGGTEIEDIEFVRKEIEQQAEVQAEANAVEISDNDAKIQSYEELISTVREYFDLKSQLQDEFNYSGMRDDAMIIADRYEDIYTDEGKREKMMKAYNAMWSEREKIKKSLKTGETYISNDGNEYLGSERDIERYTAEINALSAAYMYFGGSLDDFSSKAKKIVASDAWDLFKQAEEQDLAKNKTAQEFNEPIEEKMNAIGLMLKKQQLDPDSIDVWRALELVGVKFEERLDAIAKALGIEVPQAAQKAASAVDKVNNELKEAQVSAEVIPDVIETPPVVKEGVDRGAEPIIPRDIIPDTTTKFDSTEEQIQLGKLKEAVNAVTSAVGLKTKEFIAEQTAVKRVSDSEVHALNEVEKKVTAIRVALSNVNTLLNNIKKGNDIGAGLSNIAINVNYPEATSSIDGEELGKALQSVLSSLDSKDDKPADDLPWAREDTLKVIGGTLGQIQTNTSKIGTVPQTPANDKDSILAQISKNVIEINSKLVKGTKAPAERKKPAKPREPSVAFSADKKETQKLSLQKFKEELKASGKLTDELNKKIQGLAISLGKTTDGQGMAKWSEKFKQLKLSIGITDAQQKQGSIHNAQVEAEVVRKLIGLYEELGRAKSAQDDWETGNIQTIIDNERGALSSVDYATQAKFDRAEAQGYESHQKELIKEWTALAKRMGALEAQINSGLFDDVVVEQAKREYEQIDRAINSIRDLIHADRDVLGQVAGVNMESEQNAVRAQRAKDITQLAKQYKDLGNWQARADAEQTQEAQTRVSQLQTEIAEKQKSLDLSQQELAALERITEEARIQNAERLDAKQNDKIDRQTMKRQAMTSKAGSAIGRAESVWLEAEGLEDSAQHPIPASFKTDLQNYYNQLDLLRKKQIEVANTKTITDQQKNDLIGQTQKVNQLTAEIGELVSEYQRLSGANTTEMMASPLSDKATISEYEQALRQAVQSHENGRAQIKNFNHETKTLTYTVKTGKNEFTEYAASVRHLDNQLVTTAGTTKRTETFMEATFRKMKEITSYVSGMSVISRLGQELRRGIQYVREIDLALTELKKVTDETEAEYDQFLQTAAKTGARLGTTISAVTEATATFAKLGYSMEQATEMAESAIVYKNVGDNIASTEDAADSIISTMKGFKLEATESMKIVDRFNEVGNRFAITSQGIGEALRLSASALNEGGNSLDESIGLITAANEVVNDPSSVGTALKTLTLRLRGAKTELEEMGEDVSDMATTTSSLQAKLLALTGGKVDIMLNETTFKNSTQILREMSDAWEDMDDISRASALELMGGKRQANVLSALIKNFDTVEKAIKTSANSAGSALKENERYLDSIQGKIDQFNNAMQAMWNNTLDSGVVKWFVGLGTEIIKIIDKIGLLNSALLAFGAFKGVKLLFKVFKDYATPIQTVWQYINELTVGFKGFTMAQMKANTALAAGHLANGQYSSSLLRTNLIQWLTKKSTEALENAEYQLALAKLGLRQGTASVADVQAAQTAVQAASIPVDYAKMTTTQLLSAGFTQLAASVWGATKAVLAFLFTNPVGWAILAIGAIAGGVAIFNHFHKTTEELTEELSELKSELQDIESEIETLNSELKTTQDRMAELLAKDKLSFTEKEELENLKKQNDELQRSIDLNKQKQKNAQAKTEETFGKVMDSMVNQDSYDRTGKRTIWDKIFASDAHAAHYTMTADEYIEDLMQQYEAHLGYQKDQEVNGYNWWTSVDPEADPLKYATQIQEYIDQMKEAAEGIDYDSADPQTQEWLDYVYNLEDKWAIRQGSDNAKTNAITRILNKKENAEISDSIDGYVEALKNGDESAKEKIDSIIRGNADLVADLQASGIKINDEINEASNYFTDFASNANYSTLEGKIQEVSSAAKSFESLLNGGLFKVDNVDTGLTDLFNKEGKIIQTKLSQVFQGTSEQTRAEITRLLEDSYDMIADGLDSAEIKYLMNRMGLSFSRAILEIEKTNLSAKNLELFPGLEDEISGIIDTFSELISAVGSVVDAMDTLEQARAEEAYSGSVSLETLEALMQSTDNYADLIEVDETGAITLATNAQEILVAQKLEAIKQNAALALEEAELAYQEALHTEQTYSQTGPAQEFMRGLWNEVGGAMAFVGSLWNDLTSGNWDGAWDRAKTAQEASVTAKETEYSAKAAAASAAVAEAAKNVENAEKMNKIAQGLTPENVKEKYSSEEASGGNDTEDDIKEDAFQREMDYWENRIAANQAKYNQIQNDIDLLEAKGQKAGAEYYQEQIKLEQDRKSLLEQQQKAAKERLDAIESAGGEGSEEWWDAASVINDIEGELDDVTASILDLQDAIAEIDIYKFEEFNARLENLVSKLGTIRDLIAPNGEEDWFDDEGNWTEAGVASLGSYIQELETYKQGYENTAKELEKLDGYSYAGDAGYLKTLGIHSEQEYYDRVQELTEQQYSYLESINDTEQSVVDMYESNIDAVEEYTQTLVDSYNDYIDSVKEALDAERDLYDFKKKIQNESKNIAELERKIASISNSTNASDVASRRKLEAQLFEARESLNDTYYDHAQSAREETLSNEAIAYEDTMNRFVEGLRISLDQATANMDEFLMGVTTMVMYNADTVLAKYQETNLPLTAELTNPWVQAKNAVGQYGGDALALMNKWTEKGGFFEQFNATGTTSLRSPWSEGTKAADAFKNSVSSIMEDVVYSIDDNVAQAAGRLSELYKKIEDTNEKAKNTGYDTPGKEEDKTPPPPPKSDPPKTSNVTLRNMGANGVSINVSSSDFRARTETINGTKYFKAQDGYYYPTSKAFLSQGWYTIPPGTSRYAKETIGGGGGGRYTVAMYAKGTTNTKRDGLAITDESWIGEEITLAAGKNGQLQYLKKGSAILPADISANLVEWGKINPSMLMAGATPNVNMISNAINKPELNVTFDSLIRAENITEETLPAVKKLVTQELNRFTRELNYAIKGKGGR